MWFSCCTKVAKSSACRWRQQFGRQPEPGAGAKERDVRAAAFGWLSVPAVKSISCVDTAVLLAEGTVPYVHACTCYVFDEPLDGAGVDKSPTVDPG